jgi:hypothetical protein
MATFEINLAKSRVIPAARRRIWFYGLAAYIAITGLLFVFFANKLTRNLLTVRELRAHFKLLEHGYLVGRTPQDNNIVAYANKMGAAMDTYANTLEALDSMLNRRVRVAHVLLGLAAPLPAEASIYSVELSADKRELVFEVLTSEKQSRDDITPPNLISAWGHNPDISQEVTQITSVNRQRITRNGQGVLIWRFTGHLAGKGI